jgi:anti-sigma B factor antagonist
MEVTTTPYKHCVVIKVTGRVDSSTSPQLLHAFEEIQQSGRYKIVVDLTDIEFLSSAGLRVFVNVQKNSKRYNRGELVLACVPQKIYSALDLAGFVPFFKMYSSLTDAVGAF